MTDLNIYSKEQTDTLLGNKANASDVYTKTQVDTALNGKQDVLTAGTGISISNDVISLSGGTTLIAHTYTDKGAMAGAIVDHPYAIVRLSNNGKHFNVKLEGSLDSRQVSLYNSECWSETWMGANGFVTYGENIYLGRRTDTGSTVEMHADRMSVDITSKAITFTIVDPPMQYNISDFTVYY